MKSLPSELSLYNTYITEPGIDKRNVSSESATTRHRGIQIAVQHIQAETKRHGTKMGQCSPRRWRYRIRYSSRILKWMNCIIHSFREKKPTCLERPHNAVVVVYMFIIINLHLDYHISISIYPISLVTLDFSHIKTPIMYCNQLRGLLWGSI